MSMEIKESYGKIEDDNRDFDVEFWQAQGAEAIFEAAWDMVKDYIMLRDGNLDALEFRKDIEEYGRLPWYEEEE